MIQPQTQTTVKRTYFAMEQRWQNGRQQTVHWHRHWSHNSFSHQEHSATSAGLNGRWQLQQHVSLLVTITAENMKHCMMSAGFLCHICFNLKRQTVQLVKVTVMVAPINSIKALNDEHIQNTASKFLFSSVQFSYKIYVSRSSLIIKTI